MPKEPEKSIAESLVLFYSFLQVFFIAIFAGLAKYSHEASKHKKHNFYLLISQVLVSGLAGITVYFVGSYFNLDTNILSGLGGISGWAGAELMNYFTQLVKTYFAKKLLNDNEINRIRKMTIEQHPAGCMCSSCIESRED